MQPHLRAATIYVAPHFSGSGARTKLLEAMAGGLPIITTSIGIEGMKVQPGRVSACRRPAGRYDYDSIQYVAGESGGSGAVRRRGSPHGRGLVRLGQLSLAVGAALSGTPRPEGGGLLNVSMEVPIIGGGSQVEQVVATVTPQFILPSEPDAGFQNDPHLRIRLVRPIGTARTSCITRALPRRILPTMLSVDPRCRGLHSIVASRDVSIRDAMTMIPHSRPSLRTRRHSCCD